MALLQTMLNQINLDLSQNHWWLFTLLRFSVYILLKFLYDTVYSLVNTGLGRFSISTWARCHTPWYQGCKYFDHKGGMCPFLFIIIILVSRYSTCLILQGLVKLADFGVATKLNESEFDTSSVVGSPYWMAPEVHLWPSSSPPYSLYYVNFFLQHFLPDCFQVIELIGVCAASDIWSVGCTVIELLTCVPPYFDMQPSAALYRIVQVFHNVLWVCI